MVGEETHESRKEENEGIGTDSAGGVAALVLLGPFLRPASATVQCDERLYEVDYEADTLPEDDPVAPWHVNRRGDVTTTAENGLLNIRAGYDSFIVYNRDEPGLIDASRYDLEARFWIESILPDGVWSEASLGTKDGERVAYLHFVANPFPMISVYLDLSE